MKAVNPAYETKREHYPVIHPNFDRDFSFHFAVGMPFWCFLFGVLKKMFTFAVWKECWHHYWWIGIMLRFICLGSGSSGNCYFLFTENDGHDWCGDWGKSTQETPTSIWIEIASNQTYNSYSRPCRPCKICWKFKSWFEYTRLYHQVGTWGYYA